jgi:hypothetical protein
MLTLLSTWAMNALAAAVWQGVLLAVVAAIFLRLLPGISAAARSMVWTAVFVLVVLLPLAPMSSTSSTASPHEFTVHGDPRWSLLVAALWAGLSLLRGVQLLLSALALRRIARNAVPVVLAKELMSIHPRFTLCTSTEVDRPSVAGFFSPQILIPPALLETLSPAELQQVLLHETEHLRRRDDWTNLLQKLALVLFPLNPVLLWVERRMCLERELACDDRVLAKTGRPKAYAMCLTNLAEQSLLHRGLSLALGVLGRQSELSRRVHRILAGASRPAMGPRQTAVAMAVLLVALAGGGLQLARSPELIAFSPIQPVEPSSVAALNAPVLGQARFQPVVARQTEANRPVAVHAAQFSSQRPRRVARKIAKAEPRVLRALANEDSYPVGGTRLVLTSASGDSISYTQVSYTFLPVTARRATYAAVPTPGGWLILQL